MSRIVLAMSGGVDSSVAAHLLREAGHEVIGVFMRHGEEAQEACAVDGPPGFQLPIFNPRADHKQGCCSASDAEDARRVADRLDIPFYALNLQAEFRQIIDYFVDEYTRGRTPNPCVQCNNWLKFGKLFDYADSVGAEFVATGHYARLSSRHTPCAVADAGRHTECAYNDDGPQLLRGIDDGKDQSYVLFGIDRKLLARMLLPVGSYRKPQIRELAAKIGLRVADKKDSQEICFVTSGKHDEFVRQLRRGASTSGEIVTTDGRVVGRHPGIERFTIGQRKGLDVAMGEPHFVVRIDPDSRQVVIGRHEELARGELTAANCNWLADPPGGPFACQAKIRYNSPPAAATAEILPGNRLGVRFAQPRHGVAPGQAVVLYDGDRVLGGGWIE
ncbi:MAG: tRNA 2-thiouridine(34) synthase MnmA [Planctomycetaceae bacterium]|nr:tRNA 2-thiouridine(34) synthase MnmA [Planctomycetaceae bacterium]